MLTLEPCALNAEFQHFILRYNQISLLWGYHPKRGWGEERVNLWITVHDFLGKFYIIFLLGFNIKLFKSFLLGFGMLSI
jgi:hypothetical protein